jgi:hypothetical protein
MMSKDEPVRDAGAAATAGSLAQQPAVRQPAEQQRYAALLELLARIGLAVVVLGFAAYVLGLLPARVPVDRLSELWSLPLAQVLQATGGAKGWGWIAQLQHGDMVALAGIGLLAGCSTVALLAVLPLYLKRGDRIFVLLCLAEVGVIVLAASGWLTGGH